MVRFLNPAPLLKAHHWGDDPVHPLPGTGRDQNYLY